MLDVAQQLERNYTQSNAYDKNGAGTTITAPPVIQAPMSGTALYDITFASVTASAYTLSATPVAGRAQAFF